MTVGERIKKAREICDISQTDLAKRIGVSKQSLYKYEMNIVTNIPSNIIERIANTLDVSPCYLMGWENNGNSEKPHPKIMRYYGMLNELGKETATEQVRLLTLDKKYTKSDNVIPIIREPTSDYLAVNAAHESKDATPEERQAGDAIMTDDSEWE